MRRPRARLIAAGALWIVLAAWGLAVAVSISLLTPHVAIGILVRASIGAVALLEARRLGRDLEAGLGLARFLFVLAPAIFVAGFFAEIAAGTAREDDPSLFMPEHSAYHAYGLYPPGEATVLGMEPANTVGIPFVFLGVLFVVGLSIAFAKRSPTSAT